MAGKFAFAAGCSVLPRTQRSALCSSFMGRSRPVRAAPSRRVSVVSMAADAAVQVDDKQAETYEFQAEVSRVMNLIINSLYSNKDVFLRELISNAADACDKRRFLSVSGGEAASDDSLSIHVRADKDAGTVIIEDGGVGMTKQELINNLGSIATSGTSKFAEALGEGKSDVSLIGQFGVGFYSSYLVADKVTVVTKSYTDPNAKQYRWESTAESSFTISEDNSEPLKGGVGTRIILHVKDGCKEFLENARLFELMKLYSEFISFPIFGWKERTEYDEVPDGDEKEEDGKPKMKRVPRTVEEWSQVNKLKPIWMRRARDVKSEEYEEFYKQIGKDYQPPTAHTHFAVEGDVEFRSILFVPKMLPPELRQNMFEEKGRMLKLYVKRVFISDSFEDILPRWLCFIRGVIDSEDLPLNVSREILQKSRVLKIISKRLVRKAVDMFNAIKQRDNDDYKMFWKEFGRYIKAGIIEGEDYADALTKIAMWPSTNSKDEFTFLDDYIGRMKDGQTDIYYVTAVSREEGESAPVMERIRKKGYEVLFMVEPIDEIAVQNLGTFKAKRKPEDAEEATFNLVDISKEGFKMDDLKSEDEKKEDKELAKGYTDVLEFFSKLLSDKVGKVQLSDRLTESPSAIIQSSFGVSPTMERYMKEVGQGGPSDPGMSSFMTRSRTLEINPKHPIIADVKTRLEGPASTNDDSIKQTVMLVYELAMLTGGYPLDSSAAFAKRVSSLVSASIEAPEVVMPEPPQPPPNMPDLENSMGNAMDAGSIKEMLETAEGKNAVDKLNDQQATDEVLDVESKTENTNGVADASKNEQVKKADTEIVG